MMGVCVVGAGYLVYSVGVGAANIGCCLCVVCCPRCCSLIKRQNFKISVQKIWKAFDTYIKNGSGWILEKVEKICLNTYDYKPIAGTSYIPTPEAIAAKNAVINVQNKSDKNCFEYSSNDPRCQ